MSIAEKIEQDLKEAMTQKNELAVSVLRMLKSALHNQAIASKTKKLSDQEAEKVIAAQAKKHREAAAVFVKGRRQDLADKEKQELAVIERYLPAQLSPQEIQNTVREILTEMGDEEKNFGAVMKRVMAELKGQADGRLVSEIVKEHLAS